MSKPRIPSEFAFQVLALLAAVIVVHAFYVGLIRPSADAQLAAQAALQASGAAFVPERSLYVVIRDFEQEACFILMIWALAIMGLKAWTTRQEATMLERNLIQVTEGTTLLPQDARNYARGIEALPGNRAGAAVTTHTAQRAKPLLNDSEHPCRLRGSARAMRH